MLQWYIVFSGWQIEVRETPSVSPTSTQINNQTNNIGPNHVFQYDSDAKLFSKLVSDWLKQANVKLLQSSDFNQIENLWISLNKLTVLLRRVVINPELCWKPAGGY